MVFKKWKGILQESSLDADRFLITYDSPALSLNERALILASGIFVDLMYFENNQANSGGGLVGNILDVVSPS